MKFESIITTKLLFLSLNVYYSSILCSTTWNSDDDKNLSPPLEDADFSVPDLSHDYCIVGAGPSGLQMGYYLEQAARDYVIFEQNNKPGSFFDLYPRHRKLISINKRNTGRTNREFNLRHDWNSLLTNDLSLLFTNYTKEYFPHTDTLLKYLKDFSEKFALKIKYGTKISKIIHHKNTANDFCRFRMRDQRNMQICCKNLIVATGLSIPNRPNKIEGIEYVEYYDTISIDPKDFEGQSVLIVGRGNSGFELATSIYGVTNFVHMMGRTRLKFSWETHYVGDLRAVNNEIIDSYMLKSLDGFFEHNFNNLRITKRRNETCTNNNVTNINREKCKLDVEFSLSKTARDYGFNERSPTRDGYDRIIACLGFKWDSSIFDKTNPVEPASLKMKNFGEPIGQRAYNTIQSDKYPAIGHDYGSSSYPGVYFVGTLSHSLDFRKSAGGFIHGFRYTVRALHRLLEYQNHGIKWPSIKRSIDQMTSTILQRANEGSGIYQMFGHLGDVVIVEKFKNKFEYLEEFPVNLLPNISKYAGYEIDPERHEVFVMTMEYGTNFSEPGADHFGQDRAARLGLAELSNFLHPKIYFYHGRVPNESEFLSKNIEEFLPKPDLLHHILEDFTTKFDSALLHRKPLRKFLEKCLGEEKINLKTYLAEDCIAESLVAASTTGSTVAASGGTSPAAKIPASCHRYLHSEESVF